MTPTPIESCRVLELGCGAGGNLLPMAYTLPDSHFTGIDLSTHAISTGQETAAELQLENLTLTHQDILDFDPTGQTFDYIIAYGVYSWIPSIAQEKILGICRQCLAPQGVAYISYNSYPGWRMNSIIRDAMMFATRHESNSEARIQQARERLNFLANGVTPENSAYGQFLRAMTHHLQQKLDSYLFHDFMEDVNQPLYFTEFIEQAKKHNLQYLANAEFGAPTGVSPEVNQQLLDMGLDMVEIEQYLDFLTNRAFRETLLCHQEISIQRTLEPDCLTNLHVISRVEPEIPDPDIHSRARVVFTAQNDTSIAIAHPLTKAALLYLAEIWPRSAPFSALVEAAQQRLNDASPRDNNNIGQKEDINILATNLLQAYSHSLALMELHTFEPQFELEISEHPVAFPPARYQAKQGYPITNPYQYRVTLSEIPNHLITLLDGNHSQADLLAALHSLHSEGKVNVSLDDVPVTDPEIVQRILTNELDSQLQQIAQAGLLVK